MKVMKKKDERVKLLSEMLHGIKALKLYAWEMSFQEMVDAVRNAELSALQVDGLVSEMSKLTLWSFYPVLV